MHQCSFEHLIGAHASAPPASLPITTVHAPALFVARAFKNASFLSLKNLLRGLSAICAATFLFPLMSAGRGWEEEILRPNERGVRLISDPRAPFILLKTRITASDFWNWSKNNHVCSLYLDTNYRQMFGDVLATLRRMGPRQVLSSPALGLPAFSQT